MKLLLKWYYQNKRDLPWRRTRDPYAIWISEIMLQQTQVATAIPYYEKFLKRFSTIQKLAKSNVEEVLKSWSGLGYYSRARNLHKAARLVIAEYKGRLPSSREEILKLPGIGEYTAGAILSIAFNKKEPVLDGNVMRVLSRLYGIKEEVKKPEVNKRLWKLASKMAMCSAPGDMNQALMEFGAMVCTPEKPLCFFCPVQKKCSAFQENKVSVIPNLGKKEKAIIVHWMAAVVQKGDKYLLGRRPKIKHLGQMWEFPLVEVTDSTSLKKVEKLLRQKIGAKVSLLKGYSSVKHSIMNKRITLTPLLCNLSPDKLNNKYYSEYAWMAKEELKKSATSSLNKKILGVV